MKLKTLMIIATTGLLSTAAVQAQTFTTKEPGTPGTTVQPAVVVPEPAGAPVQTTTTTVETHESYSSMAKDRFTYAHEGELFLANEFSLDAFGHYTVGSGNGDISDVFDNIDDGNWGGGIGVNYFFTKYIGVSTDVEIGDNGRQFIDSASANLVLRLPINVAHLAPYVFGGGGGQFDPDAQWLADAGVGIDFRINHWTGIFGDMRYVWPEETDEYALFRAGLRFAF